MFLGGWDVSSQCPYLRKIMIFQKMVIISLPTSCKMFVFIIHCSYLFRPYIAAIFRDVQL